MKDIIDMEEKKNEYVVTDDFVDVYKYLNACDMSERINSLSVIERYILVALSLDHHDIKNSVVRDNLYPLKYIGQSIYDAMEDVDTDDPVIKELVEITGDKYIDLSVLVDSQGNDMPEPASQSEIRDWRLKLLD